MDFSKVKTIYMIGIKGVGMTMLAEFLAHEGFSVSGSDTAETFMTDSVLAQAGIKVNQGFRVDHLVEDFDLIIYSTAYNEANNEELKLAIAKKIKLVTFAEALGAVFNLRHGIAVSGSHGKTTTTAWLGFVLEKTGLKPNVMVGAQVPQFNGAGLTGKSNYLVIEADEYQNKLQYFNPKLILLNNIDYDHPDFYPTEASYEQAFIDFIKRLPKSGILIANFDDKIVKRLAKENCQGKIISYGLENKDAMYSASEIVWSPASAGMTDQKQYFKVSLKDDEGKSDLGTFATLLPGKHSVLNALAVIAASIELGAELHLIRRALEEFTGTARRLQTLGEFKGAILVDDYAHHPTEVQATMQAVKQKWPGKNIRVIFHPHTFSRTESLLEDFAKSFKKANEVVVLPIYSSAREKEGIINNEGVAAAIKNNLTDKQKIMTVNSLDEAENYLRETATDKDVIILMGAGDVFRVGEKLISNDKF